MKNVNKISTVRILALACVAVGGLCAGPASATFVRDPVTLDRTSTSVLDGTVTPKDILSVVTNPGTDPIVIQVLGVNYGVGLPGDNTLDVSASKQSSFPDYVVPRDVAPRVHFTVDRDSIGITGSVLRNQIDVLGEPSSSDIFGVDASRSPTEVFADRLLANPVPALGTAQVLTLDESFYSLKPGDNADSLELTNFKFSTSTDREFPVYFTLDAASPTLAANLWSTADVLYSAADGLQTADVFATADLLGLSSTDVIDGLVVWDEDGLVDPNGVDDLALFSLAPGSPFLTDNDYSPAAVFVTDFGGGNTLYMSHTELGLNFGDNIDGLDVAAIPEPTTAALLLVPALAMLRRRRRQAV